jgi:AcrR family transcriptional regulator
MRLRLMQAAVECVVEKGYAGLSISDVVKRADVTRGALFHHFSSRAQLVAEAYWWKRKLMWLEGREELMAAIEAGASLEEQLSLSWKNSQRLAPLEIEHMTATRADRELAAESKKVMFRPETMEPRYNTTPVAWAIQPGDPSPELSRFIVGYFLTGMQVLSHFNAPDLPEEALKKFGQCLQAFFEKVRPEPGNGEEGQ